ncbi:hypothetical protein [Shimia ponticola]|uniref:hypothetical protein n=1 Tax=Shimia ponticola TaxID=2582893 RepID=UPI0011BF210A|nr:hypothetical protein [Shimia ponticola]
MTFRTPPPGYAYLVPVHAGTPDVPHATGTNSGHQSAGFASQAPAAFGAQRGAQQRMLEQFRAQTPARWQAFLHAHFSSAAEVAVFFDVDDKTGRNWWNGNRRPSVDKALFAHVTHGDAYLEFMAPEAALRA